jgi:RNA polymerase sigma factor (sigma-70 family)
MSGPESDAVDAELVNRSRTGDRAAFGLLVERHQASVARLLRALFANLAGVEDLVQESFLRAYLDLERLRDPGRFGAWVRSIAVNLARMELRSGRLLLISWGLVQSSDGPWQRLPESVTERRELARRIRQAIAALPPAEREAIEQVYLNELSHKAAADELKISVAAVKVRVHRGRKRLYRSLAVEALGREEKMEVELIEVTVYDVLAKLAAEETLSQVETAGAATEQAEAWLVRLTAGNHRVILLREKEGARLLPIWVGPAEGEAVAIQLQGRSPVRPLTFDLVKELLAAGNITLQHVAVTRLHEQVFYGTLAVNAGGGEVREIDCRPSDAINLALRMEVPIFVAPDVMTQESVIAEAGGSYDYLPCELGEQWVPLVQR